ncbi:hypothetical protein D3C80_1261820 [compost metagenome]
MTCYRRTIWNAGFQAMCHLAQDFVASRGTEKVIDWFEAVNIGNTDGEGSGITCTLCSKLTHLVTQAIAIAKTSQRVTIGHCLQFMLTDLRVVCFRRLHVCVLRNLQRFSAQ